MLVSVIIPVFNNELTLKASVESILNQTYENLELVIINDGSIDSSEKVILEIIKNSNKKITYLKNVKNLGLTKSLNIAIEHCKGELIARQDSDDLSDISRIEKQIQFIDKYDVVTSRARILNKNNLIPGYSYYFPKKILIKIKNPFIHGTLLVKKETIKRFGNYNENFYYAQDYKLMKDFIQNNVRIKFIKEPLYYLNMQNNISTNFYKEQKYYARCVKKGINPQLKI